MEEVLNINAQIEDYHLTFTLDEIIIAEVEEIDTNQK